MLQKWEGVQEYWMWKKEEEAEFAHHDSPQYV